MYKPNSVVLFNLQNERKTQYNGCVGRIDNYNAKNKKHDVVLPGDTRVRVHRDCLFFLDNTKQYFAAPVAQLPALADAAAVRSGPFGLHVVATQPIRAGTVLTDTSVDLCLTAAQIAAVEHEFEHFVRKNLKTLMALPENFDQAVEFETNYTAPMVFVGAFSERIARDPLIQRLMDFDALSPQHLTLEWRRVNGQDIIWFEFWRRKLQRKYTAAQVWKFWATLRSFSWPIPTTEHRHGLMIFGALLSRFTHPQARWDHFEDVMNGGDADDDEHFAKKELSHMLLYKGDEGLQYFWLKDTKKGEEITLDCGPRYFAKRSETVLKVLELDSTDGPYWLHLFTSIAAKVHERVAKHLLAFIADNVPPEPPAAQALSPAGKVHECVARHLRALVVDDAPPEPPLAPLAPCAHEPCGRPMQVRRVCARCKNAAYCSKACQTAAWPTHKRECRPPAAPE